LIADTGTAISFLLVFAEWVFAQVMLASYTTYSG